MTEPRIPKPYWWLGLFAVGVALMYMTPLAHHLSQLEVVRAELAATGPLAPLVFVVVMTGLVAVGIPRLVIYPIAGFAFGIKLGLALGLFATVGGSYGTFSYARWAGHRYVIETWPKVAKLARPLGGSSALTVAMFRQLPGPAFLFNLVFGVSGVRHRAFLVGTLLGSIPAAIPATLIGSRLVHPDATTNPLATWGPVLLLLGMWIVCSLYLIRSRRGQKTWAEDPVLSQN